MLNVILWMWLAVWLAGVGVLSGRVVRQHRWSLRTTTRQIPPAPEAIGQRRTLLLTYVACILFDAGFAAQTAQAFALRRDFMDGLLLVLAATFLIWCLVSLWRL